MQIRVPPLAPPIAESSRAIVVGGGPRLVEDARQKRTVPNPTLIDPAVGEGGVPRSAAPVGFIPASAAISTHHQLGADDGHGTRPPATATAALSDSAPVVSTASSHHIYVGNVPLSTTNSHSFDKIAVAFYNSSRKTLSFVPPTIQNGEIIVQPLLDAIRDGSRRWSSTAVGYFLGRRPYFHHVKEYARSVWPMVREITVTSNGFFFFQFTTTTAMEEVIEGGPWLFHGQPIVLQKWEPGMVLRKLQHT
ncbi:UNVERIFIED_CONTAM: hypothetical protein Slati_2453400 [Sesamum latifolium]|uniref:DUF4283 domain-containing protein n=1 Tax=Sesamum latifolium TaxID=2727402 RepID=A0AAW2WD91_9LAMI